MLTLTHITHKIPTILKTRLPQCPQNQFYQWLNIVFNRVDEDRRKLVGPDRSCAEWLLRNGAFVKWTQSSEFVTDYNLLPLDDVKIRIKEVDATDASIMHYGFGHFKGCDHIRKIIFNKCNYLEDEAFEDLKYLRNSLEFLQITGCLNITEKGLRHLTVLFKLQELILGDLPYVKNREGIVGELKNALPNCNVQFLQ